MSAPIEHGRHESPEEAVAPLGIWAEFSDAVAVRTVGLIVGVLLLQLGFIVSYVGAFHAPTPQRIPLGVVSASPQASQQTVGKLNAIAGNPVDAVTVAA